MTVYPIPDIFILQAILHTLKIQGMKHGNFS